MPYQIINSRQSLEAYKAYLDAQFEKHKFLRASVKTGKQRTNTQNAALHVFCAELAKVMNDAGFDFRVFIKEGYPVPFNESLVKDHIWRPIQIAITGKESTASQDRVEYGLIYDSLSVKLAEYGIYVPWPSKDD
jgi:predicted ester cyclase